MTGRAVIALMLLALAVYYPVLSAGLVSDDFILVGRIGFSEALRYFHESFGLGRNEYRPVTALSFAFDRAIWGSYAPGYHFTNLLLHAVTAVMACLALQALTRDHLLSFVTAAAFLIHPINHSRAAWIAARDATVASVFLLAGLWLYVLSRRDAQPGFRLLAIPLAALAVLSYEGAVILPALFFCVEWLYFSNGRLAARTWGALRATAPFSLVAFLYVVLWQAIFSGQVGAYDLALDPASITANYGRLIYTLFWGHKRFLIGVAYVALAALSWRALSRNGKLLSLAGAIVLVSFVPYSFTQGFAHRFGYLSALGFAAFVGLCLADGFRATSRARPAVFSALAICLFAFNVAQVRKLLTQWNAAGELAAAIPGTVKRQYPELPAGTVLVFKGIPHMYGEAVLFPTGLDSAVQREYPVRLKVITDTAALPMSNEAQVLRFEYVGGDELLRPAQ